MKGKVERQESDNGKIGREVDMGLSDGGIYNMTIYIYIYIYIYI